MPRPRSDDKRAAIMSAAARIIAVQGLGAATAGIAKEAGVSNGSLFTYFATKADLLNQLYLELKSDMGRAALGGLPAGGDARGQLLQMWSGWLRWAVEHPHKRRALAQLEVSDEITARTHETASRSMAGVAGILERGRAEGPLREAPLEFVLALAGSLAETTIDFVLRDPERAEEIGAAGFEAFWRMIA